MLLSKIHRSLLATTAVATLAPLSAFAQQAVIETTPVSGPQQAPPETAERIVVVGSQIAGAETTGAVPVTVVSVDEIEATAAVSAEELFRTLPQAGDITFNGTYLGGANSNAARGDVSTVSLRGLAQGNTLALLNGRRVVEHPTSQTDNSTPVFGYNVNAIPVAGLARVEVLKEGAAALYGSDAVAGVVNNVLRKDFTGLDVSLQYGMAEGTNMEEITGSALFGTDFADGRGNISLFLGATDRTKLFASDQDYTAVSDLRPFVEGTAWEGVTGFDNRSTTSPWGVFSPIGGPGTITSNGTAFTDASGRFHVQPTTTVAPANCRLPQGEICYGSGDVTSGTYREMRHDTPAASDDYTTLPAVRRYNFFSFLNYDINNSVSFFGELGYYEAQTKAVTSSTASLSSTPITIAADAYWNPLGPVGSPNRLPGLNIPDEGLPMVITRYRPLDSGYRNVIVDNDQFRILGGLEGEFAGWNWETAVLYNEATVKDSADGGSSTLFQQALNRTTPDAYNPFNGGDPANPSLADTSPNPPEALDFMITAVRENTTKLTLADFKISRPDLFAIWSGDIGVAAGVEFRHHEYEDDRDALQDTSMPYTDSVTGVVYGSDLMGHSPSPDVTGERDVTSAYAELAVPLVSPEMGIPLIEAVEIQLAGRWEDYSDVGSVAKPKIAGFWDVFDGLRLRGSWSQGFKAPNLEVVNTPLLERLNSRTDYVQCEADIRAERISSFSQCSRSIGVPGLRQGNPDLKPEESESLNYGLVFEPMFLPPEIGDFVFTVDHWRIEQEDIVGVLSEDTAIALDYYYRLSGGTNPLVVRADPTPQQIQNFEGTGLDPVGDVLAVNSAFSNLLPLEVEGTDIGVLYNIGVAGGDLSVNFNASHLETYFQNPDSQQQILLDAIARGELSSDVPVTGAASLLEQNGRPEWKWSTTITYKWDAWQFGVFTEYTGPVYQTGVNNSESEMWEIEETFRTNLYGQYKFENLANGVTLRAGVRNVFNEDPPLADGGYLSSLYQPLPRYWYASIKASF